MFFATIALFIALSHSKNRDGIFVHNGYDVCGMPHLFALSKNPNEIKIGNLLYHRMASFELQGKDAAHKGIGVSTFYTRTCTYFPLFQKTADFRDSH